jgi:hypothetical protein
VKALFENLEAGMSIDEVIEQFPVSREQFDSLMAFVARSLDEAPAFLTQLERAHVTPYRCPCGCATIDLSIEGFPQPSGQLHILADFIFGADEELSGIFVFEKNGILSGLEVYGLAGDAPKALPASDSLKPFPDETTLSHNG